MQRPLKISRLIVIAAALLQAPAFADLESAASEAERIASAFAAEPDIAGLAVTVSFLDGDSWSEGFGYADLEQRVPVDPAATRFRVGSTAKSMTSMAVAKLYEAGKLDLDVPIQRYLPDFPEKSGTITTRLLAGHLSGIRHYRDDEFYSAIPYPSVTEALTIFKNDPLEAAPGSRYIYSTYGFNLISAIVEAASGEDFLDVMVELVFEPVGMSSTVPDRVVPIIPNRSRYYRVENDGLVNTPWVDNSNKWAGGGFLSTSEDLVTFALAHLTSEQLQPETIAMMWTPQRTSSGESTGYGIGWGIPADLGGRVIRHTGGSVGGTTDLRIYPEERMAIAVVTNTSDATLKDLTDRIAGIFLDSR